MAYQVLSWEADTIGVPTTKGDNMHIHVEEVRALRGHLDAVRGDLADQIDSSEHDDEFAGDRELIDHLDQAIAIIDKVAPHLVPDHG